VTLTRSPTPAHPRPFLCWPSTGEEVRTEGGDIGEVDEHLDDVVRAEQDAESADEEDDRLAGDELEDPALDRHADPGTRRGLDESDERLLEREGSQERGPGLVQSARS
jgi:hypothetical protein